MNRIRTLAVGMVLAAVVAVGASDARGQAEHSKLWGEGGEAWSAGSRLPDFSFAGYRRGEEAIPGAAPGKTVRDYGAKGDGRADDTDAFRRAIEAERGRTIVVPAGRYVITDILSIGASGTVLRGEGPDRSVLVCPKPLEEIRPSRGARTDGTPTSNYSWSGGIVEIRGRSDARPLARVIAPAARGEFELAIDPDDADGIEVGDDLRLVQRDPGDDSLILHVYAGDSGPIDELNRFATTFLARVAAVDADGGRIRIDRPLRTDVRPEWSPALLPAGAGVEEAGIEGIGFEFPVRPYEGHFTELGFNAIALRDARNCWVRDVAIRHADSGIFVSGDNNTLTGIVIESDRSPDRAGNSSGHHGITLGGTDNLLTDFDFRTRFLHDVTVTRGSSGNVVSGGKAVDLAMDHHRYAPHANLWTDLDAGAGTRLFRSGGGANLGWHCGAWETFWNIRTEQPQDWPSAGRREAKWGCDLMNLVGLTTDRPSALGPDGRWFEAIPPGRLEPANLHEAQLGRRLGRVREGAGEE